MGTTYVVRFVNEPDEEPLRLTQDDVDLILDLGSQHLSEFDEAAATITVATVETEPEGAPFLWRGEPAGDDFDVLFSSGFVYVMRAALDAVKARVAAERVHDAACPNAAGSCCPWMGDCDCQCMCDFIEQVRDGAAVLSAEELTVVVDCLADAAGWTGGGASTQEQALSVLRKLDPTHPAVAQ